MRYIDQKQNKKKREGLKYIEDQKNGALSSNPDYDKENILHEIKIRNI